VANQPKTTSSDPTKSRHRQDKPESLASQLRRYKYGFLPKRLTTSMAFAGVTPEDLEREELGRQVIALKLQRDALGKPGPEHARVTALLDSANLTDRQYQCALMHFGKNLSVSKIARTLGLHHSVVQDHISAAKKKIDAAWGKSKARRPTRD